MIINHSVDSSTGLVTITVNEGGFCRQGDVATTQLATQAAKTVTPTYSAQTAVAKGKYTTGTIKAAKKPYGSFKTGTVTPSNHAFSITGLSFTPVKIMAFRTNSGGGTLNLINKNSNYSSSGHMGGGELLTCEFGTNSVSVAREDSSWGYLNGTLRYIVWG